MHSMGRMAFVAAGLLAVSCLLVPWGRAADEDAGEGEMPEPPQPKASAPEKTDAGGEPAKNPRRRAAGDAGNAGPGRRDMGGPGGPGGQGGPGGRGRMGGGPPMARGGRGLLEESLYRALGIEPPVKVEQLSYGSDRRLVDHVPVGGIDNLDETRSGWKVEEVFTLTDEQNKSLEKLRDDYKAELEQMQKKFDEANAAIAAQVKELRLKYEQRANDVMTGESKAQKEKLDALVKEFAEKRLAQGKEAKPQADEMLASLEKSIAEARAKGNWADLGDLWAKGNEFQKGLREKLTAAVKETASKMKEALAGEAKAKLEELFKKIEERGNNFRDLRGRGNRPGGAGAAGEQPNAPPGNANENF